MKIRSLFIALIAAISFSATAQAENYKIDIDGQHAFIQFKAPHLGFSWVLGRFNDFNGSFTYDEANPSKSKVEVTIDVASVDSDHAKRDKHLRSADFFEASKYPQAKFVSTAFIDNGNGKATLKGNLTVKGITKAVTLDVNHIGSGKDPWGGYRRGFDASTKVTLGDFNLNPKGWPKAFPIELYISVEGIRM